LTRQPFGVSHTGPHLLHVADKISPPARFLLAAAFIHSRKRRLQPPEDVIYGEEMARPTLDVVGRLRRRTVAYHLRSAAAGSESHDGESICAPFSIATRSLRGSRFAAKFTVTVVRDIHRAVRFIHNAGQVGRKSDRLGISGASAGGHLSLAMGTQGGPAIPTRRSIDREKQRRSGRGVFLSAD
jgi:hypothetical protein